MKRNRILKWLFFDIGGVILNDDRPEQLRQTTLLQVTQRYLPQITMNDVYNAWMTASQTPGSLRIEALRALFKDSPQLAEAEAEYNRVCNYNYHELSFIRPGVKTVLNQLARRYQLGIIANQHTKTVDILRAGEILPYFSHQKMSAHIGLEKPDPKFFLSVLEDTGAKATESVMIDDNWYRGLVPAKALGMTTVLYKRDFIPYPETASPDFTINSLEELLDIFIVD